MVDIFFMFLALKSQEGSFTGKQSTENASFKFKWNAVYTLFMEFNWQKATDDEQKHCFSGRIKKSKYMQVYNLLNEALFLILPRIKMQEYALH